MDSSGSGSGDSYNPSFFSNLPWVAIVIPLAVVGVIGIVAIAYVLTRRRNQRQRSALYLDQQGRSALEQDILRGSYEQRNDSGGRGTGARGYWTYRPGQADSDAPPSYGHVRRQPRTVNRWAWAYNMNMSTPSSRQQARRVEGLDEFGEAPPPYELPPVRPKSAEAQSRRVSGGGGADAGAGAAAATPEVTVVVPEDAVDVAVSVPAPAPTHMPRANRASADEFMTGLAATPSASTPATFSTHTSATPVTPATPATTVTTVSGPSTPNITPSSLPPAYCERAAGSSALRSSR